MTELQMIQQRQALRYNYQFLRDVVTTGDVSMEPERLLITTARALGQEGEDREILARAKDRDCVAP